jgi:transposase-like protein
VPRPRLRRARVRLPGGDCLGRRRAETEAFWRSFLRSLVERGLSGVQLVVSDAHAGLKKAIAQVLGCPWQRCSVHFLREALGHARREQQPMLAALLRPIFSADAGETARELVGGALERLGGPLPKVAALLEEAEEDLSSPSTPSPPNTGRSCARPTRSSASTARSVAAPTSSGSFPTTAP